MIFFWRPLYDSKAITNADRDNVKCKILRKKQFDNEEISKCGGKLYMEQHKSIAKCQLFISSDKNNES